MENHDSGENQKIRFQIEELFWGEATEKSEVELVMDLEEAISRGEDLIVSSEILGGGRIWSTDPFDEDGDKKYLSYLRGLRVGKAPARILGWTDTSNDDPLADVLVRAVSEGHAYETRSTAHGIFEISGVSPGKYKVTAMRSGYAPQTENVEIVPAGCGVVLFLFLFEGNIRGAVRDLHGSPQEVRVDLVQIEDDQELLYESKETDPAGNYSLNVEPGRYRIGINLIPTMPQQPYPKMYAPGVDEARTAHLATVSMEAPNAVADLWLPDPKLREFEIGVSWPDGAPVKGATISLIYGRWPNKSEPRPDERGNLIIKGYANLGYRLFAIGVDPHSRERMASSPEVIVTGPEKVLLRLVLSQKYVESSP